MDILIKGLEKPRCCGDCRFFKRGENPFGEDFIFAQPWGDCLVSGEENVIEHDISENCPLVELPKHGRLIDADALGIKDEWALVDTGRIWDAPTVLEANNGTDN